MSLMHLRSFSQFFLENRQRTPGFLRARQAPIGTLGSSSAWKSQTRVKSKGEWPLRIKLGRWTWKKSESVPQMETFSRHSLNRPRGKARTLFFFFTPCPITPSLSSLSGFGGLSRPWKLVSPSHRSSRGKFDSPLQKGKSWAIPEIRELSNKFY